MENFTYLLFITKIINNLSPVGVVVIKSTLLFVIQHMVYIEWVFIN